MQPSSFAKRLVDDEYGIMEIEFFASSSLPDLPITTPFTFAFKDGMVMLALDKMGWWNPLGGHPKQGESWLECLKREANEEAGVYISNIRVVGYIKITRTTGEHPKYPGVSQLPVTVSEIDSIDPDWQAMETTSRKLVTLKEAAQLLASRTDNSQMLEIFRSITRH